MCVNTNMINMADPSKALSLLMAKRLVEGGVNLVQVNLGKNSSWDTHRRNFASLKDNLLPPTDRAMSALLDDLSESGMIDDTLVVMTGEFGRTPKINARGGRDHFPRCFSGMLAGGGIQGGQVFGKTDDRGMSVVEDPCRVKDFNATIATALGLSLEKRIYSPGGRPFLIANRGKPIEQLFS